MIPQHWRLRKQKYAMFGTKCTNCNGLLFPARKYCTECGSSKMEKQGFSGLGRVESFTKIYAAPTGFRAPYVVAIVKLDEGPNIVAQLTDETAIGSKVSAVFRKISENESDVIKYGFKFDVLE